MGIRLYSEAIDQVISKMRKYEYKLVHIPRVLYTLRLLVILITALLLPFLALVIIQVQANLILIISFSFGIAFLLFKLSEGLVRNDLHVVINRDIFTFEETSSITKKKRKKEIRWNNLKSYIFETTQYYHILKLYTTNGEKIMLTLDHNSQHFSRFENDFHDIVSSINKQGNSDISLKPPIYETKTGLVIAVALGLLMIGWPLATWFSGKNFQIGLALIFYSGAGFFIYMVYRYRRHKVTE